MKDGDAIPSEQILIMRNVDLIGCVYPTTEGELAGALLTVQAGPIDAKTTYRFFVSLQSMQSLGALLTKAATQGLQRTTPAPRTKH